ncbi:membrane protein, partial [Mycobacterium nebraskense]
AFGALGVAGLVEWPVLLAVGGSALLLQKLSSRKREPAKPTAKASLKAVPVEPAPQKAAPQKAAAKSTAKKAAGRRPGGSQLRSTN